MNISVNDIKLYFLNPKKYTGNKAEVEGEIEKINRYLFSESNDRSSFELFEKEFTSNNDLNNPIISAIHKTLADEQGLSSTRNYKEIYFNEIIQNANDLPDVEEIEITLSQNEKNYIMSFKYKDKGFSVRNLIGFFDTEFHMKKKNLSATGKHGVGIKSLFYFVNELSIESNVKIKFNINSVDIKGDKNEDTKKGIKVTSKLEYNQYRANKDRTILTISFEKEESEGIYNIKKLKDFIQKCLISNFNIETIKPYFFSDNQTDLIFDTRSLFFTDKNKDKKTGIKNIIFKTIGKELFTISCEPCRKNSVAFSDVWLCKSIIKYNDEKQYEYLIFTKIFEEKNKQNFTVAFPTETLAGHSRFYETYYIPDEDNNFSLPLLINSEYSNVSRTKLTDGNKEDKDKIMEDIKGNINSIYEIMCREDVATSSLGLDVSKLFHKLLTSPCEDINILNTNVNNKFLPKYNDNNSEETKGKYIVFKREQQEKYEIKIIGTKAKDKENLKKFYEEIISRNDSIVFDENLFIEEAKNVYNCAFNKSNFNLKKVLNIAGEVRDLFYYRIMEQFPDKENKILSDEQVDNWHNQLNEKNDVEQIDISFKMLGRYKLHPNIDIGGQITGASFFQYLFNNKLSINTVQGIYPTFAEKQSALFDEKYSKLKNRLYQLLINRESGDCKGQIFDDVYEENLCKNYEECKGNICFYGSKHPKAEKKLYYNRLGRNIYDFNEICDTDVFGKELSLTLAKKINEDNDLTKNITTIFDKIVIMDKLLPTRNITNDYWRKSAFANGIQFKRKIININFIKEIYAYSWEDFKFYYDFVQKFKKQIELNLYTIKNKQPLFDFDVNDLPEMFKFFYDKTVNENIKFKVKLVSELQNNLCDKEFFDFIKEITGYEVNVIQTNNIKNAKQHEIMYLQEEKINFLLGHKKELIGQYLNYGNKKIYIVHGSSIDTKTAIIKVLEKILAKTDIIDFCKAFISSRNFKSVTGELYSNITDREVIPNNLPQPFKHEIDISELSCKDIIKIILARGNNDGKCSCCGKKLIEKAELVIVSNQNEATQNDYPKIFTVACSECRNILESSLDKAELDLSNNKIKFTCNIMNTFQKKEVVIKSEVSNEALFKYNYGAN